MMEAQLEEKAAARSAEVREAREVLRRGEEAQAKSLELKDAAVRRHVESRPELVGRHECRPSGRLAEAGRTWVPPRASSGAGKAFSAPFWPNLVGLVFDTGAGLGRG